MERITRKQFVEMLNNNSSILMGSVFRWTDEKCKRAVVKRKEKSLLTDGRKI